MSARRAERDADAELVGALRHGVGSDAIEADGGEQEREYRKAGEERRDEASARPDGLLADECFKIDDAVGLLIGIHSGELPPKIVEYDIRRDAGANEKTGAHPQLQAVGRVDCGSTGLSMPSFTMSPVTPMICNHPSAPRAKKLRGGSFLRSESLMECPM